MLRWLFRRTKPTEAARIGAVYAGDSCNNGTYGKAVAPALATLDEPSTDTIDLTPAVRPPGNHEIHFDIDLLNKCNLQCPTCFRGVGAEKNTPGVLPLDHFREIVDKARREGYPNICLINWTEARRPR